jgi:hypothetical protein
VSARPTATDFGVVIPAKSEHLHWVRGTCASVRYFMGDTPICVVLDGEEFPDELRTTYDLEVVRREEVQPRELRELSFGSLKAKNAALWASPFETFLLLDADTVVWGDMRLLADFDHFDFVLDAGGREPLRSIMDVELVNAQFPHFRAKAHAPRYANTGAYFGRCGALDLDRYLHVLRRSREHPRMFYGSQGALNFMLFTAVDEGKVRIHQRELQVMTGRTSREEVVSRFSFVDSTPLVVGDPVVLHWVGSPKPRVRQRGSDYFKPMTHFRLEYRRTVRDAPAAGFTDGLRLRLEDAACTDWRGANARGRLARLRRRIRQGWARGKVAIRRRTPDWIVTALGKPAERPR